ncbi:MAG: SRPBCC family protein [Verrucomicrobia subdivision 3 bacterium]|nr:SRPBCC family protein [Limisphaerales bacterium]
METIEKSIEVDAPISTVYNQWTQFEEFPRFMEGVKEVRQLDEKRLHWVAEVAGKRKEWDAEIFEQTPDQRIAWRSTVGARNSGQVSFQPIANNATRIALKLNYDPEGATESIGDALGVVGRRVEGDLKRFKEFIQARQHETGAWRGEIHGRKVQPPGSRSAGPSSSTDYGASGASGLRE